MSVCPFCKAPAADASAPCPRCGKLASEHPSIAAGTMGQMLGDDFGDDDVPDLILEKGGGSMATSGGKASDPYEGQGVTLDDDLFSEDSGGPLELDVPTGHGATSPRTSGHAPAPPDPSLPPPGASRKPPAPAVSQQPPPGSGPSLPAAPASAPQVQAPPPAAALPPSKPSAAQIVAKYPAPPDKVWLTPVYAVKVFLRQLELRQDLASLRKRRSPDVALYEAALHAHDSKTFLVGVALSFAGLVLTGFVVFLPVILRSIGD